MNMLGRAIKLIAAIYLVNVTGPLVLAQTNQHSVLLCQEKTNSSRYETSEEDDLRSGHIQNDLKALYAAGRAHGTAGRRIEALKYYNAALARAAEEKNLGAQAEILNDMGWNYWLLAHYQKALRCFQQSLIIRNKNGDVSSQSEVLHCIGKCHRFLGEHETAIKYFQKALEMSREFGNTYIEAESLREMGYLCSDLDQNDCAEKNLLEALAIFQTLGTHVPELKDSLAHLYLDQGRLDKAALLIRETRFSITLGRFFLLKGDYVESIKYYMKALQAAQDRENVGLMPSIYLGLGMAYERKGNYGEAEKYYEKAVDIVEDMRNGVLPSERKNFFDIKICGFRRSDPAKCLTRVRMKGDHADSALEASELAKARSFADKLVLRCNEDLMGVPKAILEKEEQFVSKIIFLRKELDANDTKRWPERHRSLKRELGEVEKHWSEFLEMLWRSYKPYAAVKYPRPLKSKDFAVVGDEYAVIFDLSEEGVASWLLKGCAVRKASFVEWRRDDLERAIRKFREPFERCDLLLFDIDLARSLYNKLLAPLISDLVTGRPIIIVPDGLLALLPFEALVVEGKAEWKQWRSGEYYQEGLIYLADQHPVSYHQSITALTLSRTMGNKSKPRENLLVVADPVFELKDPRAQAVHQERLATKEAELNKSLMEAIEGQGGFRFSPLPETGKLAQRLDDLFKPRSTVMTGMRATKASFLKDLGPHLADYGRIVFATHGYYSMRTPELREPFLALTTVPPGTDGLLTMSDVLSLKLSADLVALTACQSGLGRQMSGEGVMSMGRAFQFAGARSVLMSLWSVAEQPSVALVERFFRSLKEGKGKVESLRLAREEVRKQGYDHPFFWAGFILVGETQ